MSVASPAREYVPFDQVVTEECVLRESAVRRLLERIDVVDPFSGEAPFAEQILIDVRHCSRVWIDARMSGVNRSKDGLVRARERHSNSRLENSVALGQSRPIFGVVIRAVQRMRDRPDEQLRGISWKYRVRIERYDVAHRSEPARIADDCGNASPRSRHAGIC